GCIATTIERRERYRDDAPDRRSASPALPTIAAARRGHRQRGFGGLRGRNRRHRQGPGDPALRAGVDRPRPLARDLPTIRRPELENSIRRSSARIGLACVAACFVLPAAAQEY